MVAAPPARSAKSENIDAKIDVMLNQLYLKRASGNIEIPVEK